LEREPVRGVRTVDRHFREHKCQVKRLLVQHGYPPDKQEKAIELVIEQAEIFVADESA
jgi:type I restriction enzyme R subunit